MNRIVIIGVYFGKFSKYIELWEKSCNYNDNYDYMIFTDQIREDRKNVKYINFSLEKFSKLASEKLKMNIKLENPYKCCDFKVVYGLIFEEYIADYDFWGHCDFDMIFGNLNDFLSNDIFMKFDKILTLGHLSLYRNNESVNQRYKDSGSLLGNYKEVFSNEINLGFDELKGIYSIYKKNNYPMYEKRIFADISAIFKQFKLAMKFDKDLKNYKEQVFYWENGNIYRAFIFKNEVLIDEFAYIHFQKRGNLDVYIKNIEKCNSFIITNKGFFEKEIGTPRRDDIKKYNKYNGKVFELFEKIKWNL